MENEKPKLWKRILAVFSSLFITIGVHGHKTTAFIEEAKSRPTIELLDISDDVKLHYNDFAGAGKEIISFEDVLNTNVGDEICDTMVPQGLTMTDKYILVSAYCGIEGYKTELRLNSYFQKYVDKLKEEENHKTHNSVIYIYDRISKDLVVTLELPDKNHVGGIAFDGENGIYIAKSSDKKVSKIKYDKLEKIVDLAKENGEKSAKINYEETLKVDIDASFITYRENKNNQKELWIGTFSGNPSNSVLKGYRIKDDESLELSQNIKINCFSQRSRFCYCWK